ncbi:mannitol dehydrogenase family protein, partial [Subtercola sp. YIM 133946]|uniref:mannitol dehydrogenase family protein n=1 Tax=Subtercola sp. YIM 133946 TaxID=3118909 RepID=UPI002F94CE30
MSAAGHPVALTRETVATGRIPLLGQGESDGAAHETTPPVRIVHLGLGAFHRAHQAWYTAHASDAADWGIAAFTSRSATLAEQLTAQGGLYTLVERGADADSFEVVGSLVAAFAGDRVDELVRLLADPSVVILTLTVTEAGYHLAPDARLDLLDDVVRADIAVLRRLLGIAPGGAVPGGGSLDAAPGGTAPGGIAEPSRAGPDDGGARQPATPLGRILLGLDARRRAGAPPLAIVPCDNVPDNGAVVGAALLALAAEVSPLLAAWLPGAVSFVSTSVDRITPRATPADADDVLAGTGLVDAAPVVTEPFSDWVLCGSFPSGRPAWHTAGARFVDDIGPWETRKLWMLNGAHTLLASSGRLRGHSTVAEAIADPRCLAEVHQLWNEDARHLADLAAGTDLDLDAYRLALLERFANPRIEHRLEQIAQGAEGKLRMRVVPVARLERASGRPALGCALTLAAYLETLAPGDATAPGAATSATTATLVATIDAGLAADDAFVEAVEAARSTFAPAPAAPAPAATAPAPAPTAPPTAGAPAAAPP